MNGILVIIGILFFCIGVAYIYRPDIVLKINQLASRYFFNDAWVMFRRKKVGIMFFFISVIALYFAMHIPAEKPMFKNTTQHRLYYASCKYYLGEYAAAEKTCNEILLAEPGNQEAMEQLCLIHFSRGDYKKAKLYCEKVLKSKPGNVKLEKILEKCIK
jgi:tetratricopeptide (TPR) repeat protein